MTDIVYGKNECYTPRWVFDTLGLQFDLDVASSNHALVEVPTKHKYTIDDDAYLSLGLVVYG